MTVSSGRLDRRTKKDALISELHWRICQNIREIREELGFSQQKVAAHLGVSQPTYNALENCRNDLMLGTLERIAEALSQPVEILIIRNPKAVEVDKPKQFRVIGKRVKKRKA